MEEKMIDDNPEIKTFSAKDNILTIEKTHSKPTIQLETYSVAELQKKIAKINSVISLWEAKKKPYQDLIDLYNEHKPFVEPTYEDRL